MKSRIIGSMLLLAALFTCSIEETSAQNNSVRIDALAACSGTVRLGVDLAMSNKWSADLSVSYNPIETDRMSLKHHTAQIGAKYWLFGVSAGHFIGQQLVYAGYDVRNAKNNYKGNGYGGGLSYGYSWILATRLSLSAEVGLGVLYCDDVQTSQVSSPFDTQYTYYTKRIMLLPTRFGVNVNYLF
ncbi:MAG: DUF3575 domain-containing protein [Rikenellaceae bacterium]